MRGNIESIIQSQAILSGADLVILLSLINVTVLMYFNTILHKHGVSILPVL